MKTNWGWFKGLGIAYCNAIAVAILQTFVLTNCAIAQITADETLPNNSIVRQTGNTFNITGGTRYESNLFHSFQQFSPNRSTAFFDNATGIQNIISRVTGGTVSNIDGLIRANGSANLFLINPNGIIFGQNARLSIGGSFIVSTASSLRFTDGFEFSATNPQPTSLLTINVPIGLQYGANPKPISNQSQFRILGETVGLNLQEGKTLALVGGDVSLDGGILSALGGQVELGGLAEPGTVNLNRDGNNNLSLSFPDAVRRANVTLTDGAEINVASGGGGSIAINALNINVSEKSRLRAGISLLAGSNNAQAGNVTLNATETVKIEDSFIYNAAFDTGNGGNISINTRQLMIQDGIIATATISQGRAGDVFVSETDSVELSGSAASNGTVTINIPIFNDEVTIPAPIGLFSASLDASQIVNVSDSAPDLVKRFVTQLQSGGDAGNLTIDTGRLTVRDGAVVSASTTSSGRGGNLTVRATDVELSGTSLQEAPSNALFEVAGRVPSGLLSTTNDLGFGGDLAIETERLVIKDGAWMITGTGGENSSGSLTVNATESVTLSGTSRANGLPTVLAAGTQGSGNAGNLTINTKQLIVRDGAIVSAGTSDIGKGGDLVVNASDVQLIGTSAQGVSESVLQELIGAVGGFAVFSILGEQSFPSGIINGTAGQGKAGDLTLNTGRLLIQDGAQASVSTVNEGDAGSLTVIASSVELTGTSVRFNPNDIVGPSLLTSAVSQGSTGKGGNIDIFTDSLFLNNGAQISASTAGQGDAGKINVQVKEKISLDNNSQIRSTVEPTAIGNGNQISIQGRSLSLSNSAQINAQTQGQGKAGSINLNITEDITLSGSNTGISASTRDSFVERRISVTENGDVGQLLDTAQDLTFQPGFYVTRISGNLSDNNDVDLYKIFLSGGQSFSATTIRGSGVDTQLFLFDADGKGVYANDDSRPGTRLSTLPAQNSLTPTQPGFYYLGISSYNNDPQSTDGTIFPQGTDGIVDPLTDFTVGPVGPGGGLPLSNWNNRGGGSGNYTITFRGTAASQLVFQPGGDGGNIEIQARSLFATDGAQVTARTSGQGKAGDVTINTRDTVFVDGAGSEVSANTAPDLTSQAGNLTITTNTLQVQNQARVTVSSPQGQAGNLNVTAKRVLLDRGNLIAETGITGNEEGANITLKDLDLLLMRNGSRISAQASGSAKGGNITIDAPNGFVIAALQEDNDIIASASRGQGGNVVINTQRIFGFIQGKAIPGNGTNDIDVSSEFSNPGTVTINTLYIDPNRGLIPLPTNLVDASNQIATGCTPGSRQRANSFTATGRGGIAPSPTEPLIGDAVLSPWVTPSEENTGTRGQIVPKKSSISTSPRQQLPHQGDVRQHTTSSSPIVEASGWVVDRLGNIELVAYEPVQVSHSAAQIPVLCQ